MQHRSVSIGRRKLHVSSPACSTAASALVGRDCMSAEAKHKIVLGHLYMVWLCGPSYSAAISMQTACQPQSEQLYLDLLRQQLGDLCAAEAPVQFVKTCSTSKARAAHLKLDALCRSLIDAAEGILAQVFVADICKQQRADRDVSGTGTRPSLTCRAHSQLVARA